MHMMGMKQAGRTLHLQSIFNLPSNMAFYASIIQECEDALTNWVSANAAVAPKLSARARTLSQRRHANARRTRSEGHDLSGQDAPLRDRESSIWVPASQHQR